MIRLPAYFLGFNSKSDGSAGLRFGTQELSADDFAELKRHQNDFGWLLFKPGEEVSINDLPEEELVEDKEKSPSKRLRASIFVLWKQQGEKGDFESYYRLCMKRFIEQVKTKLD